MLSEQGANWEAVGASVTENKAVENMERIFKAARANGFAVFISPHPTDSNLKFNGPLETDEFGTHTFARSGPLNLAGSPNSGANWLDRFEPYIEDDKTVVVSSHKVWAPQTNDLVLQLGKRRIYPTVPPDAEVVGSSGLRRTHAFAAEAMGGRRRPRTPIPPRSAD